jgi:hypothetical protein
MSTLILKKSGQHDLVPASVKVFEIDELRLGDANATTQRPADPQSDSSVVRQYPT